MKIAVYGSRRQEGFAAGIRRFLMNLIFDGNEIYVHEKLYDYLTGQHGFTMNGVQRVFQCPADCELAVSLGGDGTLLRTVAWTREHKIPVLGVNTGHLGYLTAISLDEALENTEALTSIDFKHTHHSLIQAEVDGSEKVYFALNEVVVAKEDSASMITADTTLNDRPLASYKADGLIVATPTGSTAYNLSVGGPIIEPEAPVFVISPIAAHSLSLRPIVVRDSSVITITVTGRGSRFRLVVDGNAVSLQMGTTVRLSRAARTVDILQQKNRDFTQIIGSKLLFNG